MKLSRLRSTLTTVTVVILALGGCSTGEQDSEGSSSASQPTAGANLMIPNAGFDADGDGNYTYDEYRRALDWAIEQFAWPPGVTVTSDLMLQVPANTSDIRQDAFEVGLESVAVSVWYSCAWMGIWIDATRNQDRSLAETSLDAMVNELPNLAAFQGGVDSLLREIAQSVRLGDPSRAQSFVNANCVFLNGYPWWEPPFATPALAPPAPAASPVASPLDWSQA